MRGKGGPAELSPPLAVVGLRGLPVLGPSEGDVLGAFWGVEPSPSENMLPL